MRKCFALALLLAAGLLAQPAPVALPAGVRYVTSVEGINEYRLPNGLRVLLFADPTKTNITVNITYLVGSRHEDYGETGMAHLLEHLLFKGSTKHPNIPKELDDHGARPNGTTDYDRTNYFETVTATDENLRWALSLEADRMVNSFIAKKDLDTEFTVVRNEFEAGENDPESILSERTMSTAFLWHNYGKSVIGARSDIEQVPIERLQAFYRHFYQPDNALLIVAGKFDEARTLALVKEYFGPIPKPTRALRRTYTVEPVQDGERSVTLRRNGDVQALCVVHHVPAGPHEDFIAVDMAADILGDQPAGRLYKALVETRLAAAVSTHAFQQKEPGAFMIQARVPAEAGLAQARAALVNVLEELKAKPFTDDEVERIRTRNLKNFELLMNNSEAVAMTLSEFQAMGDWRLLFVQRDRIRKTTRQQVQQAAEKYFISSNRTIGEFHPDKNPQRAEIPAAPDVAKLVDGYKGDAAVSKGEEFDPSPANIDRRTIRGDLQGGLKLGFINKKTRGNSVVAQIQLHFGDEKSLHGMSTAGSLTGAMLMRGTTRHTRQQLRDEFDRLKATVGIGGSATGATATIQTTRENLPAVLDLVAEVLKEPSFPADEFETLRTQRLAALDVQKNDPEAMAVLAAQRHASPFPPGHPRYYATVEEQIANLKAATLDDLKKFHQNFYGASSGEVVIIGDFEPEGVQKQIAAHFNTWQNRQKFTRIRNDYRPIEPEKVTLQVADKANAMFVGLLNLRMRDTDPEYPALVLANYMLGESGLNARLFARIRGKEGLSYGVYSMLSGTPTDDNQTLLAVAICAPENAPKVEASFKDEIRKIGAEGFAANELEDAKKSWLQQNMISRANDQELLRSIASGRFFGRTMAFDAEMEAKVQKLTVEQVNAVFKKYITPGAFSLYRAGDFAKVKASFE